MNQLNPLKASKRSTASAGFASYYPGQDEDVVHEIRPLTTEEKE